LAARALWGKGGGVSPVQPFRFQSSVQVVMALDCSIEEHEIDGRTSSESGNSKTRRDWAMKVRHQTKTKLILSGVPGTLRWMVFAIAVGLAVTGFTAFLLWIQWEENGPGLFILPLSVGMLVGTAFVIIGVLQLFARERLILDKQTGKGQYESNSPVITTEKTFEFRLEDVHSVVVSTQTIEHPVSVNEPGWSEAKECKASLRVVRPRRSVTLDETQNGRVKRVIRIAEEVAGFLSTEVISE